MLEAGLKGINSKEMSGEQGREEKDTCHEDQTWKVRKA